MSCISVWSVSLVVSCSSQIFPGELSDSSATDISCVSPSVVNNKSVSLVVSCCVPTSSKKLSNGLATKPDISGETCVVDNVTGDSSSNSINGSAIGEKNCCQAGDGSPPRMRSPPSTAAFDCCKSARASLAIWRACVGLACSALIMFWDIS